MCKASNISLLDDLKHLYGLKKNVEVAERFNIPIKTIEAWIFKNEIPSRGLAVHYIELLIENAKKVKEAQKKFKELEEILER